MRAGARAPSLRLLLVAGQLTFLIATSAAVFENERRDNAAAEAATTEAALIFLPPFPSSVIRLAAG